MADSRALRADDSGTEMTPTEYRADLVLLLNDGVPVFGIVLEVQLQARAEKRFTWPAYVTGLRARWRCPCCVLVVTPSRSVAAWASAPIDLGQPGSTFRPLALGPDSVPWVTSAEAACAAPELAILSALAHENEEGGLDVALAALAAAVGFDSDRARLCYDLVWSGLNEAVRHAFEELMQTQSYELQSEFLRNLEARGKTEGKAEGEAQGKAEGKRESLLMILDARKLELTAAQLGRIAGVSDLRVLDEWILSALAATSADEVLVPR